MSDLGDSGLSGIYVVDETRTKKDQVMEAIIALYEAGIEISSRLKTYEGLVEIRRVYRHFNNIQDDDSSFRERIRKILEDHYNEDTDRVNFARKNNLIKDYYQGKNIPKPMRLGLDYDDGVVYIRDSNGNESFLITSYELERSYSSVSNEYKQEKESLETLVIDGEPQLPKETNPDILEYIWLRETYKQKVKDTGLTEEVLEELMPYLDTGEIVEVRKAGKRLSNEELLELGMEYKEIKNRRKQLEEIIFSSPKFLKLVNAKSYGRLYSNSEDQVQEISLKLLEIFMRKYNPFKSNLKTYMEKWGRPISQRYLQDNCNDIREPSKRQDQRNKVKRIMRKNPDLPLDKIAKKAGMSEKKVLDLLTHQTRCESVEKQVDDDLILGDTLAANGVNYAGQHEDQVVLSLGVDKLYSIMKKLLRPNEMEVLIRLHFSREQQVEVASGFRRADGGVGVSHTRIQQLERSGLKKLRESLDNLGLELSDFL